MNNRVREVRQALGMSQKAFSEELNLSENFIFLIEKGDRNMSDRTIADICKKFNVNECWLRNGTGSMFLDSSVEEEITAFCADVLHLPPDDTKFRIMKMMAQLPQEDWDAIEHMIDLLLEKEGK